MRESLPLSHFMIDKVTRALFLSTVTRCFWSYLARSLLSRPPFCPRPSPPPPQSCRRSHFPQLSPRPFQENRLHNARPTATATATTDRATSTVIPSPLTLHSHPPLLSSPLLSSPLRSESESDCPIPLYFSRTFCRLVKKRRLISRSRSRSPPARPPARLLSFLRSWISHSSLPSFLPPFPSFLPSLLCSPISTPSPPRNSHFESICGEGRGPRARVPLPLAGVARLAAGGLRLRQKEGWTNLPRLRCVVLRTRDALRRRRRRRCRCQLWHIS